MRPQLNQATGVRGLDIVFANVGWVSVVDPTGHDFELRVWPVEGSHAWARPPLYEMVGAEADAQDAAMALRRTPPAERAYDVAHIERYLQGADSRGADDNRAEDAESTARATAQAELGSRRRRAPEGVTDGIFGERERQRMREEIFGPKDGETHGDK